MTTAIKTKYVGGVFQPLEKVNLPEDFDVTIRIEATISTIDNETREWLNAELTHELPPYDWGKEGVPKGKPVRYDRAEGFVIIHDEI